MPSTVQKEALTIDETIPRSGGTLEYGHYLYTNRQVIPGQEQTSALESISLTLCGLEQLFLGYRIEVSDGKGIDGMLSLKMAIYEAAPVDYTYQGWYLDGPGVVEMSVRNGKAVFTDKPLLPFQVLRFLRLSKQNQEEPD